MKRITIVLDFECEAVSQREVYQYLYDLIHDETLSYEEQIINNSIKKEAE